MMEVDDGDTAAAATKKNDTKVSTVVAAAAAATNRINNSSRLNDLLESTIKFVEPFKDPNIAELCTLLLDKAAITSLDDLYFLDSFGTDLAW